MTIIGTGCLVLSAVLCVGCEHGDVGERADFGEDPGLTSVLEAGETYQLAVKASGFWQLSLPVSVDWCSVEPQQGSGDAMVKVVIAPNYGNSRSVELILESGGVQRILQVVQEEHREDWEHVVPGHLEIPRLSGEPTCMLIRHEVDCQGEVIPNYSLEYDLSKRHARWVAFTAYDEIAEDRVKRTEAWADDPEVPEEYRTTRRDYSGFDRGHLVASNDRRFCREANEQTFYYSNMSPQLAGFNQKIWQKLEENVKAWMRDGSLRDTLYVVKGGTIEDDQILQRIGENQVVVPRYYFMAVLSRKKDSYRSIAFGLVHKVYAEPYDLQGKVITVDELERKTGIDFFPALPDSVENRVESVIDVNDWEWVNL